MSGWSQSPLILWLTFGNHQGRLICQQLNIQVCNDTFKSLIKGTYLFSPVFSMDIPENLMRGDTVHRCTQEIKDSGSNLGYQFENKHTAHYSSKQSQSVKRISVKSYFSRFLHTDLICFQVYTMEILFGLCGPAVRHVITAVTHLSTAAPYRVGESQERVTLWPVLTEGVNHVFINTLWCGRLWFAVLSTSLTAVTRGPERSAGEDCEECLGLTCCE